MTSGTDEPTGGQPLSDDDITSSDTGSAPQQAMGDADGTDGTDSDSDSQDADGTDGGDADGSDADGTDGSDGISL